mgnify:CR=1 FL=1
MEQQNTDFIKQTLPIGKRENGKTINVGEVAIYIPTLASAGINAEVSGKDDDGLPEYKDDKVQYIYNALVAAVKGKARNALITGTADLKPGLTIAADWDALLAEGVRGGGAEALAAVRALKKAFADWVAGLGKSAKAQLMLNSMFGSRNNIAIQDATNKAKFADYLAQFAEQLDAETLEAGQKYLQSLLDTCTSDEGEDEDGNDF